MAVEGDRAAFGRPMAEGEARGALQREVEMLRAQLEKVEGQLRELGAPPPDKTR
jgi:t-SNARE complex subunit (syntaxin)